MHKVHSPGLDRAEKRTLWDEILNEFSKSDLGQSAYCRKHKIRYDNFNYYLRAQKQKQLDNFIPVTSPMVPQTTTARQITIITDKLTIHLPTDLEPQHLANVIKGVTAGC